MQWFLSMQHFADLALPPVMNDEIKFYPTKYKVTYKNWLENIKDWCISRQLWWGHRIPAWYLPKGGFVVAENAEEALALAKQQSGDDSLTVADLHQDEDALDTWFSSWLWPISLFKGINEPGNEEIKYYYPTSVLVTGPDIIFFWVARMIMAGYEYMGDMPFKSVYFTGIVRDKLGRKMSKSLGNCIYLSDSADEVWQKVRSMFTDPTHLNVSDPGHVEGNAVFTYLDAFSTDEDFKNFWPEYQNLGELKQHYTRGGLGDMKCKKFLNEVLNQYLEPMRQRRAELEKDIPEIYNILKKGTEAAREVGAQTMSEVRKAMQIDYFG
jgi:valyl-tRNA synthetase